MWRWGHRNTPQARTSQMLNPMSEAAHRVHRGHDGFMQRAFELRYQVYCLERNFLSAEDYPGGAESDEYDANAAHFYAFNINRELVGYVRLVRPDSELPLPIQKHCTLSRDQATLPAAGHSAEVSRLMVRSEYRRNRGDRLSGVTAEQNSGAFAGDKRHEAPQILLNLYRQMYVYSRNHGIRYWYAAMERPLARSLLHLKFAFRCVGPETNYYGPVAPYLADLRELEVQVGEHNPALLAWMQKSERLLRRDVDDAEGGVSHLRQPYGSLASGHGLEVQASCVT